MRVEEIGGIYADAARKLRESGLFSQRRTFGDAARVTYYGHVFDSERTKVPRDAEAFARDIGRIVDQVVGELDEESFESEFVVNLEGFSRMRVEGGDEREGRRRLGIGYVPVRLVDYLRHTTVGERRRYYREVGGGELEIFGLGVGVEKGRKGGGRVSFGMGWGGNRRGIWEEPRMVGIEETSGGPRIRRSVGWLTGMSVLAISSIPVVAYLVMRIGKTDVESVIQTALAIAAGTLLVVASPLHRILFRNWGIAEALSGRMTLDVDTVGNIRGAWERREVGIGLIVAGNMRLVSGQAGYAGCYGAAGLNPGLMMLGILTRFRGHRLVVDQNGALVLRYSDGQAVQLVMRGRRGKERPLRGRRYVLARHWYVLDVDGVEEFLVQ